MMIKKITKDVNMINTNDHKNKQQMMIKHRKITSYKKS